MPELPEVETISLQLNQTLRGLRITKIEVTSKKNFVGLPKDVIGQKVEGVSRRAKIILIKLSKGKYLAIHLKLTGQLIYRAREWQGRRVEEKNGGPFAVKELPNKFTTIIISFDNGGRLYFNDLRKFGWMRIISQKPARQASPGEAGGSKVNDSLDEALGLEKFGPEANDENKFTLDYFRSILAKSKKPIKLVIMDQEKLAGVGNIYANEVLFRAKIMPTRPASSLSGKEIERLRDSILSVLKKAIEYKGTSDTDEAYRQISGEKGNFQSYLQVYGRAGEKCPGCGGLIERSKIGGRGTFFCPACQR